MKTILLNCLPPAMENCASPALSVLKHTLQNNGFKNRCFILEFKT